MAQLPDILDRLTPEAQRIYDRIAAKRGPVRGPYAPLMHHPALAEAVAGLSDYLRFGGTLPGDVRELAILVTARALGQAFEWVAHAPITRREGLPETVVEHVRVRGDLAALPPRYAPAARVIQHVLACESLPQALQDEVARQWGVMGVVELVVLAGFYQLIAGILFAFDEPLPEGASAPF
jgi:4-carboxymuconolactone decarboxylase